MDAQDGDMFKARVGFSPYFYIQVRICADWEYLPPLTCMHAYDLACDHMTSYEARRPSGGA